MALLQVKHVRKTYTTRFGGNQVHALYDVDFSVETGEYVAVMGESGSGKTTLLNILATLDKPTSGEVWLDGKNMTAVPDRQLAAFRRENLGFVFQDFNLLDNFSIRDNIFLPLVLAGKKYQEMEEKLVPLASSLGITSLLEKFPYEVSGGQKQRAAVAVSMVCRKDVLIFDEPTSGLDYDSMIQVAGLFQALSKMGKVIFVVTHDYEFLAAACTRVIHFDNGKQQEDYPLSYDNLHRLRDFFLRSERRQNLEENGK